MASTGTRRSPVPNRTVTAGRRAVKAERSATGGPAGNEQLTAATGVILLVLLAALGVTILQIGPLIWLHFFLGLLLIGPIGLKMASTGYRFIRYYTGDASYVRKGPPEQWLRLLAPGVVLSTIGVFTSGVVLLFVGPAHRGFWFSIHKVTFFVWLAVTGLHVLGHLPGMPAGLRATSLNGTSARGGQAGGAGRAIAVAGAVVGGLVLAVALIPQFATWTAHPALWQHHHHDG
ncbi:MAG: hypothetical protein ABI323_02165 [Solirubrobacteraceae bacterium]